MIGGAKKNTKNEAKCEMCNMSSGEGLNQDGSIAGRKTKPPILNGSVLAVRRGRSDWVDGSRCAGSVGRNGDTGIRVDRGSGRPAGGRAVLRERNAESTRTNPKACQVWTPFSMGGTTAGCTVAAGALATFSLAIAISTVRATKANVIALG